MTRRELFSLALVPLISTPKNVSDFVVHGGEFVRVETRAPTIVETARAITALIEGHVEPRLREAIRRAR